MQARVRSRAQSKGMKQLPGWGHVANPSDWKAVDDAEDDEATEAGVSRIVTHMQPLDLNDAIGVQSFSERKEAGDPPLVPGPPAVPGPSSRSLTTASQVNQSSPLPKSSAMAGGVAELQHADQTAAHQDQAACSAAAAAAAEAEDDAWEKAGKSRNAERHRRRKQLKWEARQGQLPPADASADSPDAASAGLSSGAFPAPVSASAAFTSAAEVLAKAKKAMQEEEEEEEEEAHHASSGIPEAGEGRHEDQGEENDEDEEDDDEWEEEEEDDEDGAEEEEEESDRSSEETSELGTEATGTDEGSLLHINTTSSILSLTADFAMQNVLLQMGLRLVTRQGQQITR